MIENGRGLIKALENWAKKVTSGYKDVNVTNLSTSFRDGLAFCAIIHHYRPDLVDFESLRKENIFENNSLAFSVAEKQLGVPALLDAEDMVTYPHPDRLSIITYLSQLRNCFENQNKVNSRKIGLKGIQANILGPHTKVPVVKPSPMPTLRHEMCQVCKHRVFILERLIVDGKLYHTTCFRCHKCNCLLNPGAYVESDTLGLYECSVCLTDEVPDSFVEIANHINESERELYLPKPQLVHQKEFTSKESVKFAKSNLSEEKPYLSSNVISSFEADTSLKMTDSGISVKDKITAFEKNQVGENSSIMVSTNITPDSKLHQPLALGNLNEAPVLSQSSRLSLRQSPILSKSSEKGEKKLNSDNFVKTSTTYERFSSIDGRSSSNKLETSLNVSQTDCANSDMCNDKKSNFVTQISVNKLKDIPTDNKDIFSVKTNVDTSSKGTRDIFKSSLQPLKFSFPSSIRKESTVTSPDSQKAFDIPEIKKSSSVTLPRLSINRNMSLREDDSSMKQSISEFNLSHNTKLGQLVRRSSLESSSENSTSKELPDTNLIKSSSKNFNRTISAQEISERGFTKSFPRSYSPIYKSMTGSYGLTNSAAQKDISCDSLKDVECKTASEVKLIKKKDAIDSELLSSDMQSDKKISEPRGIKDEKTSTVKVSEDLEMSSVKIANDSKDEEEYPDDLNPFGEYDSEIKEEEYPDDLNPFGDEDVEVIDSKISTNDYDESKNPFASDDDEGEIQTSILASKPPISESTFSHDSVCSDISSPSGSLKGTLKKRAAPRPPTMREIFPKDSVLDSSNNSMKSTSPAPKRNFQTPSPKIRKNKPAPPPPLLSLSTQDPAANIKMAKETDNLRLKSSTQNAEDMQPPKQYKKKKRPAPSVPVSMKRDMKKIPLKEIIQEMKEIEEKQREYERQGREIELLIRDKDKEEEASVEEEEYIMQLFELVNHKNALFRRQAELMYIKRSQRLEEQQYKIEKEIRLLMEKQESEKNDEDRRKEEELTLELIDIVDQRNSIIDSIEMDRRRELEEDHSVQEQLDIKNGDLPIAAELKQKQEKSKSKKHKKDKKKQDQDSKKGTLKKKKLFSKPL